MEEWRDIEEFPGYAVSDEGRILNDHFNRLMTQNANQQGIMFVGLMRDGRQYKRSVALLVAEAFLAPPPREDFDTPINLDGDRSNNFATNLEWRPRWFAIKYHAQFNVETPFGFKQAVEILQTGEIFDNVRDCVTKYGLLEKEVILAAHNRTAVFPTWQEVQIVHQ